MDKINEQEIEDINKRHISNAEHQSFDYDKQIRALYEYFKKEKGSIAGFYKMQAFVKISMTELLQVGMLWKDINKDSILALQIMAKAIGEDYTIDMFGPMNPYEVTKKADIVKRRKDRVLRNRVLEYQFKRLYGENKIDDIHFRVASERVVKQLVRMRGFDFDVLQMFMEAHRVELVESAVFDSSGFEENLILVYAIHKIWKIRAYYKTTYRMIMTIERDDKATAIFKRRHKWIYEIEAEKYDRQIEREAIRKEHNIIVDQDFLEKAREGNRIKLEQLSKPAPRKVRPRGRKPKNKLKNNIKNLKE